VLLNNPVGGVADLDGVGGTEARCRRHPGAIADG
jgi:hypothetical protein